MCGGGGGVPPASVHYDILFNLTGFFLCIRLAQADLPPKNMSVIKLGSKFRYR